MRTAAHGTALVAALIERLRKSYLVGAVLERMTGLWTTVMRIRRSLGVLGFLVAHVGGAQSQEFQVNTYTTARQGLPSVAMDSSGRFAVVWQGDAQDGSALGIFAQRYDGQNTPLGLEFQVNTYTPGYQARPSLAMDDTGRMVVVWQSREGEWDAILGQRFDSQGNPLGAEFQVNTLRNAHQRIPGVAMDAEGGFIVVWVDYTGRSRVRARRFEADGSPIGSDFKVVIGSSGPGYYEVYSPAVATGRDGRFVVAWRRSWYQDSVVFRHHSSSGLTCDREVAEPERLTFDSLDVEMTPSGAYVVAYTDGNHGIRARRFQGCGPRGDEIVVNTDVESEGRSPRLGTDASGNFIVTWESLGFDILARRFNDQGEGLGDEFLVNTYVPYDQRQPAIAMNETGRAILAWQDYAQDGSQLGVYARVYEPSPFWTLTPTSTPTPTPHPRARPERPGGGVPFERTPRPIDRPSSSPASP